MPLILTGPKTRRSRALFMAGIPIAGLLVTAATQLLLDPVPAGILAIATFIAVMISTSVYVINAAWESAAVWWKGLAVSAYLLICVTGVVVYMSAAPVAMSVIGEQHEAEVTSERHVEYYRSESWNYTVTVAGERVPGEVAMSGDYYDPGDRLTVVVDPSAIVAPQSDLDVELADLYLKLVLCGLALSIPALLATGYFPPEPFRRRREEA